MTITKEQLDTPICEAEAGATNTETFRQFIENSELEFDLIPKDLDNMSEKLLNEYLEFLDYLWEK